MKNIVNITLLGMGLMLSAACTDLTEKNYSNIDASIYYEDESSVQGALAAIYGEAGYGFCEYFFYLNEFSADQVAWRTWNGGMWGWDEGLKFVLSSQTWTSEATIVNQAWEKAWKTIALCNQLIADLENLNPTNLHMTQAQVDSYIAEVRTLRAWAYYNNFELWGGSLPLNIEVTTKVPGSASDNFDEGCQIVYDFIIKELDESCPSLMKETGDNATRNRVNQAMNRMLKMRLLLNAKVFVGQDKFADCKTLCEDLLKGTYGTYSLATDYRQLFEYGNETCPEVVFAFAMANGQLNFGWMRDMPFLPYNYDSICGGMTNQSGWNCCIAAPSYDNSGTQKDYGGGQYYGGTENPKCFLDAPYSDKLGAVYARFEAGDIRKQNYAFTDRWNGGMFLTGAQKSVFDGHIIQADADRTGQPLYYIDQVGQFDGGRTASSRNLEDVMSPRWGQTNSGYRIMKYPVYPEATGIDYQNIHEVEFRWAEVIYTYAECLMRLGNASSAREQVNSVRKRYFTSGTPTDATTVGWSDEEWMLDQWGLEFLCEGRRRRTDLRRFDQFTKGQWWFFGRAKDDAEQTFPAERDRKYEWFPLPASALSVNPGLKQNPNY